MSVAASVLGICVVLVGAVAPDSDAEGSALNGVIAAHTPQGRIALVDSTSGGVIDTVARAARSAHWSPDGTHLAYISNDLIYIADSDGQDPLVVPNVDCVDDFSWSPSGDEFAFVEDCVGSVNIVDIDGQNSHQIFDQGSAGIDWSLDGEWLALSLRKDDGTYDVYKIRPDGTQLTQLTVHPTRQTDPSWSPSGTALAFSHEGESNHRIAVIPASGGTPDVLTPSKMNATAPDWSADGSALVFSANQGLGVVSADGSLPRIINDGWFAAADWQSATTTIRSQDAIVTSGTTVRFTVRLAWPQTNDEFLLQRRAEGEDWRTIARHQTGADGITTIEKVVRVNALYRIRWLGDPLHIGATSAPTLVEAKLRLKPDLKRHYDNRHRWHLYHDRTRAVFDVRLDPPKPKQRVCFLTEWHTPSGRWREVFTDCYATYDRGRKVGIVFWGWSPGTEGRIRAIWTPGKQDPPDVENLASQTPWHYFKFTH